MISEIEKIGNITPYPFQHEIIEAIKSDIREQWGDIKEGKKSRFEPKLVEAYVSAGKTIIIGAICNYANKVGANTLVLARTGELVEQNSDECWNMNAKNSVFSASLGLKSTRYNTVVGTEGTVANALNKQFKDWCPHIILIDECHEVFWREVLKVLEKPDYVSKNQYALILARFIKMNPKVAIIGVTGTPYRGVESIMGHFWKGKIGPKIDREFLVDNGYIVPTVFGNNSLEYDMSDWDGKKTEGTEDFSNADLKKMGDKADVKLTHRIMKEVIELTKNRLGALVTCASERHCKQAAEVLPDGTWAIVTQSTNSKKRRAILERVKKGEIKFIFQIGCLTTGVNVPFWDTSVILRRIGSLTLLTQLLGRGMRLLKPEHEKFGWVKSDHLVLDYSGTMEAMQQLFDDPLLDEAELSESKKKKKQPKICPEPKCKTENGFHARRCIGRKKNKQGILERCDYFWKSIKCDNEKCKVKNDPCASSCRACGHEIRDPNENLSGKHYGPDDWHDVVNFEVTSSRNGGIVFNITYGIKDEFGRNITKSLYFKPWSSMGARQMWKIQAVNRFVANWADKKKMYGAKSAEFVLSNKNLFRVPVKATYRKDVKSIHGLDFGNCKNVGGNNVRD